MHRVFFSVIRNLAPLTFQPADRKSVFGAPRMKMGCSLLSANCAGRLSFSAGINFRLLDISSFFNTSPILGTILGCMFPRSSELSVSQI